MVEAKEFRITLVGEDSLGNGKLRCGSDGIFQSVDGARNATVQSGKGSNAGNRHQSRRDGVLAQFQAGFIVEEKVLDRILPHKPVLYTLEPAVHLLAQVYPISPAPVLQR